MIEMQISMLGLQDVINTLDPTDKHVEKALNRTLGRMAKWLQTRTVKGLSSELAIAQKIVRRRMRKTSIERTSAGFAIKLWYGLNDIALIHLNARKTRRGVTAGAHKRDGAFIAKGQVYKRQGKARLPIEVQMLEIKAKADAYLESMTHGTAFEDQFLKTLEHELKWQMRYLV